MTRTVSVLPIAEDIRSAARQALKEYLDHLAGGRVEEWVDLFTQDGELEFPYAPMGYPSKVSGRSGLRQYISNFAKFFRVHFIDLRFHDTAEPSLVIAEFRSQGVALATGRRYEQTYISVVETIDGKISRYVDFWNPLVAERALRVDPTGRSGWGSAFTSF